MLGEFARGSTVASKLTPQVACASPSIRPRREWLKRGLQCPTSVCPPALPIGSDARSTYMPAAPDIIIGVDPHKASWTAAAVDRDHRVHGILRVASSAAGYRELRVFAAQRPGARWAIEGGAGLGRPLAHRLLEEHINDIVDVPAKLSARVRALGHGHGRKTDAADAVSTAIAARTTATLQRISPEQPSDALRLLSDRRDDLVAARTQTVNRLHAALTALIPGGAPTTLTAPKAAE